MSSSIKNHKTQQSPPLSAALIATSALIVLTAYSAVLLVARSEGLWVTFLGALANTIPIVLLGLAARSLILRHLTGRSRTRMICGHVILGLSFIVLSYWSLLILLGVINGVSATEFDVRPFDTRAMAWQSLQNMTTYGLIAALSHLQARPTISAVSAVEDRVETPEGPGRYFVRIGDEIRPLDLSEVISIVGADDYAEVRTPSGRRLVRMTLTEFEAALDPGRFIRVHRSSIVNLDRIDRAEPAGNGRLLLHMEDGELIQTSRAGARLVRDRFI
jgi:two-component system LytT family response regulator